MTGILALLMGGAVVVGLCGHRPLVWLAERRIHPTILLTGWLLTTTGLVASVVATIGLLALSAEDHAESGMFHLAGGCWAALTAGVLPGWRELLGAVSLLGIAATLLRLCWAGRKRLALRRRQAPHVEQLRLLARGSAPVEPLWVRDDRLLAMSIGGRPGLILMSDALRSHLTPRAVAAALEHERAHLRGRHHALVAVVEVLATALPAIPLLRHARPAIRELVELAADAEAARRCGSAAVREALCRLTGQPEPSLGLGMVNGSIQARLARLSAGSIGGRPAARFAGCVAMSLGALLLPAVVGWLAVSTVACVVI